MPVKDNIPVDEAMVRDALRYRFLRSKKSRDHKHHSRSAFAVRIIDWAHNLVPGDRGPWSGLDVFEERMDTLIDAHMLKGKRRRKAVAIPNPMKRKKVVRLAQPDEMLTAWPVRGKRKK